jgi:hypothetical protein
LTQSLENRIPHNFVDAADGGDVSTEKWETPCHAQKPHFGPNRWRQAMQLP